MRIEEATQQFITHSRYIKGYSEYTLKRYKTIIDYYASHTQITNLKDVTQMNTRSFLLYGRVERKWTASTFLSMYMGLVVFFRWCRAGQLISIDPTADIELPKLEKRIRPKLTKQESLRLLEVIYNYPYHSSFLRHRNHAIFSMFLFAGLRRSELIKLRLMDVDLENLSIFVNQGKGYKDRIVPMSFTLATSLGKYVEDRKRLYKTCSEFFTSSTRDRGITEQGIKLLVAQLRKSSGINFTCHKLRHTFATLMLEGGCDIYSLSKMMGHSDIKTTTIYLAASAEHLRTQIFKHPLNIVT